uniref:Si:dkey-222b8.4 n=1 Tax=Oryzias latipes TaxID=8090 RepID=A0A3P9KZ17_ORYLA
MSNQSILNGEKAVSPSQVVLEKMSSSVLKCLLSTSSNSCNLFQAEEQEKNHEQQSQFQEQKTSGACRMNRLAMTQKKPRVPGVVRSSAQTNIMPSRSSSGLLKPTQNMGVVGRAVGLNPPAAPKLRRTLIYNLNRAELPTLQKARLTREAENGRKLCIFAALKPSNVQKEKQRFFKSTFSCNPQFEYSSPVPALILERHSVASDRFLTQAVHIMELALERYGSYERFEQVTGGSLLSKSRIYHNVKKYMETEGCVGEITVQLSDDLLSRASMTVVNSRHTLNINVSSAREHWLEGILRHEIGTHYLRSLNNCQQPWSSSSGRKRLNLRPLNPTEEGLASIHSVLFRRDPTLWRAAMLYYTVYQASHMSFCQLFQDLGRFVENPSTRWDYCVRAKRGQTDTAQPGCFSKDQVYLDGVLRILRYRDDINFPLLMALGKVSFEDVDRLRVLAQMDNSRIPHFMQDQVKYAEQLTKIMTVNQLTDEELKAII